MPRPWIEPTLVELHQTRGTFWKTLYGLSYTAAALIEKLETPDAAGFGLTPDKEESF